MLKVVVNSTPLMVLGKIGKLEILHNLYGTIYITEAVYNEIVEKNDEASRALISSGDWIKTTKIEDPQNYKMFQAKLHAGEVETMILAQQKSFLADLVILDDLAARNTARFLGLKVTGTMGVIVKAKQKRIIPKVRPVLEEIINNGFYISKDLVQMILKVSGELEEENG